jgi:tRNA(Glu) U13 pseudouridine synthase TruD
LPSLTILDLTLPVYVRLSEVQHAKLSALSLSLPGHRAFYADPILARIVQNVLAAEGFELNDLKARILRRAYLPKGQRALLLHPNDVTSGPVQEDGRFSGRQAMRLSFTLPPGAFATLVLKRLAWAYAGQSAVVSDRSEGAAFEDARKVVSET